MSSFSGLVDAANEEMPQACLLAAALLLLLDALDWLMPAAFSQAPNWTAVLAAFGRVGRDLSAPEDGHNFSPPRTSVHSSSSSADAMSDVSAPVVDELTLAFASVRVPQPEQAAART